MVYTKVVLSLHDICAIVYIAKERQSWPGKIFLAKSMLAQVDPSVCHVAISVPRVY